MAMSEAECQLPSATNEPVGFVDEIASAYLREADGNPSIALQKAIRDAVADFLEMERRTRCAERLVSRGFVRGMAGREDQG
jgi:hypothetical protein